MTLNILYIILVIIIAIIITLAIGVRRMERRWNKKIEELRGEVETWRTEKGGDSPDSSGKIESDKGP